MRIVTYFHMRIVAVRMQIVIFNIRTYVPLSNNVISKSKVNGLRVIRQITKCFFPGTEVPPFKLELCK